MSSFPAANPLAALADWPVTAAAGAVVGRLEAAFGDVDTVFDLASVTKLLTAYAALVAVEEGAIELDGAAGPPGSTVRHLLAHASGLGFEDRSVLTGVGVQRIYSSAGFEVLAETIEEATGIGFAAYLAESVLAPLAMTSTELPGSPGHGARSTVHDLTAFARELLAPTLVHPSTLAEATTVQFPGLDGFVPGYGRHRPNDWGLGFEIRDSKSPHWTGALNSAATAGHFGQAGTFMWVDPAVDTACVVLTNRPFGAWAKPLWPAVCDAVVTAARARVG